MSFNFITFGSHDNYVDAMIRLYKQAKKLNIFNKISAYSGDYLKNDIDFWKKHKDFIENNKTGYGYWLWKPYIIKKEMEKMNDGDILLYIDCGCELYDKEKSWLNKCIEYVKKDLIIGTYSSYYIGRNKTIIGKFYCYEKEWTKMDLVMKLNMNNDKYLESPQHQAGVIMFYICNQTRKLVNEWYDLGCDYCNIDNSPSINKNLDVFKEHRHDQSIFSLLTKKYDIYSKINLDDKCIKYIRNRTGNPIY